MFYGHCCFAVKDKIFFSASRVITGLDAVLLTHMQTESPRDVCDVTSGSEQMTLLVPSHLHLLIMGPGENYLPSPSHCILL